LENKILWVISAIGAGCLSGVFLKMNKGIGAFNLKVIGIVLIAILASLLALLKLDSLDSAFGILGAIAGYLFGSAGGDGDASSVKTGDILGRDIKIAGKDINEFFANLDTKVEKLTQEMVIQNLLAEKIKSQLVAAPTGTAPTYDYLVDLLSERNIPHYGGVLKTAIEQRSASGWILVSVSTDYQGMDGAIAVFAKPSYPGGRVEVYKDVHR
jgi:hypothetical protein